MLTMVPAGVNLLARQAVMNHPNTMHCELWRRSVVRPGAGVSGGMGTLGGMGVMSSADEVEIEWEFVGHCYGMPSADNEAAQLKERGDAPDEAGDEIRFLLEPEEPLGEPGGFEIRKDDVFFVVWGEGDDAPRTAYEITAVETMVRMPPYVPRYVAVRRDDLDLLDATDDDD